MTVFYTRSESAGSWNSPLMSTCSWG